LRVLHGFFNRRVNALEDLRLLAPQLDEPDRLVNDLPELVALCDLVGARRDRTGRACAPAPSLPESKRGQHPFHVPHVVLPALGRRARAVKRCSTRTTSERCRNFRTAPPT